MQKPQLLWLTIAVFKHKSISQFISLVALIPQLEWQLRTHLV